MNNYILADILRISKKKSFIYTISAYLILFFLMLFIYYNSSFDASSYILKVNSFMGFSPLILGLVIFLSVYYDDFKSKSMQVAIGYGISRNKVILSKLLVTILLSIALMIIMGILFFIAPIILGLNLVGNQNTSIILTLIASCLKIIGFISISTMLVYHFQNAVIGTVSFVLLASNTITIFLMTILSQNIIVDRFGDVTKYLFTRIINTQTSLFLEKGHFDIIYVCMILLYIILPTILAMVTFKKKELEF